MMGLHAVGWLEMMSLDAGFQVLYESDGYV